VINSAFYKIRNFHTLWEELNLLWRRDQLSQQDILFLADNFPNYAALAITHKAKFNQRLEVILTIKEFIPRGELRTISREMKLLISAIIVMITFGWSNVRLAHFRRILVYPDSYYSTISKKYHRGEVNPTHGIIVISCSGLLEGLKNDSDGINLGIHEVAHALKLENQIYSNNEFEFFDTKIYTEFQNLANREIAKINTRAPTIFRLSGGFNDHEFFAVALEVFFERPTVFFEYNPHLYGILVQLLQQDPRVWLNK